MKLLLDTHIAIWMVDRPDDLTDAERALIVAHDTELFVSVISLWEIRTKIAAVERRGRGNRPPDPGRVIAFLERMGITIASLLPSTVTVALHPPLAQFDPFDEMLLVQAGELRARLLTRDSDLRDHPLAYHP